MEVAIVWVAVTEEPVTLVIVADIVVLFTAVGVCFVVVDETAVEGPVVSVLTKSLLSSEASLHPHMAVVITSRKALRLLVILVHRLS